MWDMNSPFAFARAIAHRDFGQLQSLISRFGYPTAWSAIRYLLGSHDQIFNQWEYNPSAKVWQWDKPGASDLGENRYFVELIGGAITGRNNWYARALGPGDSQPSSEEFDSVTVKRSFRKRKGSWYQIRKDLPAPKQHIAGENQVDDCRRRRT